MQAPALCNVEAVRTVVEGAPNAIDWLSGAGVDFDLKEKKSSALHLAQEGGHSYRRVAHVADSTGRAVVETLEPTGIGIESYRSP